MIKERKGDDALRVCDGCGHEQWVSYWNLYRKPVHLCRYCNNVKSGEERRGKYESHNKGKKQEPKSVGNYYINSSGYSEIWVGKHTTNNVGGYYREHRMMMELELCRELTSTEIIHHINGDKMDNWLDNLYLCEDDKHHRNVHGQLERVSMELVRAGAIKFDKESGQYYLDPYVREFISKSLELLGNPEEGNQQRSLRDLPLEERSTTIQKWSTLKRVEAGDTQETVEELSGDDIVCSA